jgi:predicted nucleotidyltransferase
MRAELSKKGWKQEKRREHRWHSPGGEVLDIIPAGMQLRQDGQITWPASEMVMSLVGFEHVFKSAIDVPALGTDSRVVPPVVLALLKVVAFMRRTAQLSFPTYRISSTRHIPCRQTTFPPTTVSITLVLPTLLAGT